MVRVQKGQPLTLRSTLWLVMALTIASAALGAIGLHSYRLYRQSHLGERLRAQAVAETYAAQLEGDLGASRRADLQRLTDGLRWHPDSRLIALLGPSGESLAVRGAGAMLERYRAQSSIEPGPTWQVEGSPTDLAAEYVLAAVPLRSPVSDEPLGTLVYAMIGPPGPSSLAGPQNWDFFIYLAAIAAVGVCLSLLWLKRRVLDPVALLARFGATHLPGALIEPGPVDEAALNQLGRGDDEIGTLARTLAHLQAELDNWRTRATYLERTLDDRVAHATQRITRELKRAQRKTWTDPLTRLGNRRLLDEKFAEIFHAQAESKQELAIVMLDVDNFKPLNDALGHTAGDDLLRFTGELLRQCLRDQDLAVRYGGDEFMLILPSVSPEQARAIAERTIAMFAQHSRLLPVRPEPTLSAGIACLQRHRPESAEALLEMADAALYAAKHAGKSCVKVHSPALETLV